MAALDEGLTRAQTLELSAEIRLTQREKAATGHATRRASTAAAQAQRRAEFRLLPMPRHCVRRAPPEMPQDGGPTLPREPQAELRMNPGHDSAGEAFRCRHAAANVQVMRPLRSAKRTTSPVLCRFNFSIRLPR